MCFFAYAGVGGMALSRFGRFTKEFGIVNDGKDKSAKPPILIYGDVDVIFATTIKSTPRVADVGSFSNYPIRTSNMTFGKGDVSKKQSKQIFGQSNFMTSNQFIAALKELAVRLYGNIIEKKTGTVFECLPSRQQQLAARAAFEVMMLKKLVPAAEKLGLIPWALMVLDQTLTSIHTSENMAVSLASNVDRVAAWYLHYSTVVVTGVATGASAASSSPLYASYTISSSLGRPAVMKQAPPPPPASVRGVTYKSFSKFFHDFGIVPYLIKEPQLFRKQRRL